MKATHCPLCFEPLEVRDVAPCMGCGWSPEEIEHCQSGRHAYAEYRLFETFTLTLCNVCVCEFHLYDPAFFGVPADTRIRHGHPSLVREIQPVGPLKDKGCPRCRYRLPFLAFVAAMRSMHP